MSDEVIYFKTKTKLRFDALNTDGYLRIYAKGSTRQPRLLFDSDDVIGKIDTGKTSYNSANGYGGMHCNGCHEDKPKEQDFKIGYRINYHSKDRPCFSL